MRDSSSVHVIVENEAVRNSIYVLLNSVGIHARTFGSAQAFLQDGLLQQPACVVANLVMERTSGLEILLELHRLEKAIPVILFLDHSEDETPNKTIRLGSYGYLQKPFAPNSFLQLIRTILDEQLQSA